MKEAVARSVYYFRNREHEVSTLSGIPYRPAPIFRMRAERSPLPCGIHSARIRNMSLLQEKKRHSDTSDKAIPHQQPTGCHSDSPRVGGGRSPRTTGGKGYGSWAPPIDPTKNCDRVSPKV